MKDTNEEKARKIAKEHKKYTEDCRLYLHLEDKNEVDVAKETAYAAAIEMAQWKDDQFAKEKKKWVEKACDYIYNHAHVTTFHDIRLDKCSECEFVDIFKKAMEE